MGQIFQTVMAEFARLYLLMPIQIEDKDFHVNAILFAEELEGWSPETIKTAFREHAKLSRFVPSLSQIIANCRTASQSIEYTRQRKLAELPMPDHLPDEVVRENLRRIKQIKQKIFKRT